MGDYSVTKDQKSVTVIQTRLSLLALGAAFILGGSATLYLWWRDRSGLTDLESVSLLLVSVGVICGGVWSIFQPLSFYAQFDTASGEFFARWKGLRGVSQSSYPYAHLRTMTVKETDDEGYWYTPQIRLDDGDVIDLGFGDQTPELAEELVNQLVKTIKTGDKAPQLIAQ